LELVPQAGGFPLHLVAPAPGSAQKFLAHTGLSQGKVIQSLQSGENLGGLLINNPIRTQPPAAAAWQAGITAAHQVVEDPPRFELNGGIGHDANGFLLPIEQGSVDQRRQTLHRGLIRGGRIALHQGLQLGKTAQLIEPPNQTIGAKSGWLGDPTQHPMNRRMHPHRNPGALILPIGAMDATAEDVA
jgi:hypothetical protein